MTTAEKAALEILIELSETIRKAGEIPSGHLYAAVMGLMDIHTYNRLIDSLKRTGLVVEKSHLLMWVGPHKGEQ